VEVRGLQKTYLHGGRQLKVLNGIDFTLRPGEMAAVVGASGAGKSTLLHILGTLDAPTQGQVRIDGTDVTKLPPAELARFRNRTLGFVFQFHHLLPEFTALENTMMPALIQRMAFSAAETRAREVLREVGLADRLTHKPGELSGGEQQRVALARALVLAPRLLLADEPTGNLDTHTGAKVHDLLYEISRARGTTMLIVTHNPELARRMPVRLHMIDGRMAPEGDA
jgi:lipoprotein-releasing system ATP-binding protein